jgi:hypothetical protein
VVSPEGVSLVAAEQGFLQAVPQPSPGISLPYACGS